MNRLQTNTSSLAKFAKPLAKGCGCLSVFFLIFFVWGIWTTITTYSSLVEVQAKVIDLIQQETVFLDARYTEIQQPVVSYKYKEIIYTDTLKYKLNSSIPLEINAEVPVLLNPDQPQFTVENGRSTFYFYFVFLFLSIMSLVVYKIIKKPKVNLLQNTAAIKAKDLSPITNKSILVLQNNSTTRSEQHTKPVNIVTNKNIPEVKPWLSISIALIIIIIGIGMGFYKFSRVQTANTLKERGVKVKGVVTKVIRDRFNKTTKRGSQYTIGYTFESASYTCETYSRYAHYNLNEELILLVNPNKPSQALLLSVDDLNRGSYLFALFLLVIGLLIIKYNIKKIQSG